MKQSPKSKVSPLSSEFLGVLGGSSDDLMKRVMDAWFEELEKIKGDKGDDGYTPVKGKDYFTEQELSKIIEFVIKEVTPVKGIHYWTPQEITTITSTILKLATPKKGVHYFDGEQGEAGKNGSPDTAHDIAGKLNSLKGVIDSSVIKGTLGIDEIKSTTKKIEDGMQKFEGRIRLIDQRWHGAGLLKVAHDASLTGDGSSGNPLSVVSSTPVQVPVSGAVNGVNQAFVFTVAPTVLVVDQGRTMTRTSSDGTVNWTGTTTVTLALAPTFDIFMLA